MTDDAPSDGNGGRVQRPDRIFHLLTTRHGPLTLNLGLTIRRQIFVGVAGAARKMTPEALVDRLALASLQEFEGRQLTGEWGVEALKHVGLFLTGDERVAFATAFLAYNVHLHRVLDDVFVVEQGETETRDSSTDEGVTVPDEPVARLHFLWTAYAEESAREIERINAPMKALQQLAVPEKWQNAMGFDPFAGASRLIKDMERRMDPFGGLMKPYLDLERKLGLGVDFQRKLGLDYARKVGLKGFGEANKVGLRSQLLAQLSPSFSVDQTLKSALVGGVVFDKLAGPTAGLLRQDREKWAGLRSTIGSIAPRFETARAIAEGGFNSIVKSLLATDRLQNQALYRALAHEPGQIFTKYLDETGKLARSSNPRIRHVLETAAGLGAAHFGATSEVTARLLRAGAGQEPSEDDIAGRYDDPATMTLLEAERDELVGRAENDPDALIEDLAASAPLVRLATLIGEVLTLVYDCNEVAQVVAKQDVFVLRNRTFLASAQLPQLLPRDRNTFDDAVDHLYFLIYEGAGSDNLRFLVGPAAVFERADVALQPVFDLKFLRSKWLRHDPERGGSGREKTYEALHETFVRLGCAAVPRTADDFRSLYWQLLQHLRAFLSELRTRLDAKLRDQS